MNNDDMGLAFDLEMMAAMPDRRQMLRLLATAACLPLVGCAGRGVKGTDSGATPDDGSCSTIPPETAGPFPGNGTNGADALELSGIVRSDIRSSIGSASGTAEGVVLTLRLRLVDSRNGCAPLAGHAVYIWHCDREGRYSMYGTLPGENYLRGVQVSDENGELSFTTIFPGCYPGRWPHIHFEVYPSLDSTSDASNKVATSQLAFPRDACEAAYASEGYEESTGHLAPLSLSSDGVFEDGASAQLAAMSGNAEAGFVAELEVGIG